MMLRISTRVLLTLALTATSALQALANNCPSSSEKEYLWSRYVFCRDYIAHENKLAYLAQRFDGAEKLLSVPAVERLSSALNSTNDAQVDEIGTVLARDEALRITIRGLLAREAYSERKTHEYCAYKFPPGDRENLSFPRPIDPGFIQDVDYILGCEARR